MSEIKISKGGAWSCPKCGEYRFYISQQAPDQFRLDCGNPNCLSEFHLVGTITEITL